MPSAHQSHRTDYIDILRGFAVLGMMLAHSIFFFHDGSNALLNTIQQVLNLTMFPLFVFASGLALSSWLDTNNEDSVEGRTKIIKRTVTFYLGYVMLAIFSILLTTPFQGIQRFLFSLLGILTFTYLPNFTEYFPFFIILSVGVFFLGWFYRRIRNSLLIILVTGIACYVLGLLLYPLQLPFPFDQWKALFASGVSQLRFPLLFYMLTYFTALWWYKEQTYSKKIGMLLLCFTFLIGTFLLQQFYDVSFFSPFTRWPPSLGNILLGIALAGSLTVAISFIGNTFTKRIFSLIQIVGIYAFECWIIHMLLLFIYDKFIHIQIHQSIGVLFAYLVLVALTLACSLIGMRFHHRTLPIIRVDGSVEKNKRFQKLYLVICIAIVLFLTSFLFLPNSSSLYGDSLKIPSILTVQSFPEHSDLRLTADNVWVLRSTKEYSTLTARASLYSDNSIVPIDSEELTFVIDGIIFSDALIKTEPTGVVITVPSTNIPVGNHTISVFAKRGETQIQSNVLSITVSEPLLFAWTFDWEGWNAPDSTLEFIDEQTKQYKTVFTHFISPRTFSTDTVTQERKKELSQFLKKREQQGDEIAMHLHMHFDFAEDAGVTPRTQKPWGLYTEEGYDVPTTEYTNTEFNDLIRYGQYILSQEGFKNIKGYRAGGWFLSTDQLNILEKEGFRYDSSAREKPVSGAFQSIPWNIPFPAQPYYPDVLNQNKQSSIPRELLEIPNNGGNTYEFTSDEIFNRLQMLYKDKPLETPTLFVVVSHPQFSSREFSRISELQKLIDLYSIHNDNGPIVFTTMNEIDSLWRSFNQY